MIHRPLCPKPGRANSTILFLVFVAAALASGCTKKADPVEVVIAIEETSGTLSSATVLVDYSGAAAAPLISSGRPACASIAPNVDLEFSDGVLALADPGRFLASPGLWGGLVVAALLIAAAVWVRRYREET